MVDFHFGPDHRLAAPAFASDKQPPSRMPSEMTLTEIKAYNAGHRSEPSLLYQMPQDRSPRPACEAACLPHHRAVDVLSAKGNENARDTLKASRGPAGPTAPAGLRRAGTKSPPSPSSTFTVESSPIRPASISSASGSCRYFCTARFSGRAPYTGS